MLGSFLFFEIWVVSAKRFQWRFLHPLTIKDWMPGGAIWFQLLICLWVVDLALTCVVKTIDWFLLSFSHHFIDKPRRFSSLFLSKPELISEYLVFIQSLCTICLTQAKLLESSQIVLLLCTLWSNWLIVHHTFFFLLTGSTSSRNIALHIYQFDSLLLDCEYGRDSKLHRVDWANFFALRF